MKKEKQKKTKGFTLLEMLVVVLIIGILAGIALPQYQMAVTKAKVASILPLMRRFKDALTEYKLQHGDYEIGDASDIGVNWPSDWNDGGCEDNTMCSNDYWVECGIYSFDSAIVGCFHNIDNSNAFGILMYHIDDPGYQALAGMTTCEAKGTEGEKVCKALGGKLLENVEGNSGFTTVYNLN